MAKRLMAKDTNDYNIITAMSNQPNLNEGYTPEQLKAYFDQASLSIQDFINNTLIEELQSETADASGAQNIGYDSETSVTNVADALDEIYTAGIGGLVPDDSISTDKIVDGAVTKAKIAESERVPPGTVIWVAQSTAPAGYLKANGAAVSRSTYSSLFDAIGTTFGSGDGSTTFDLPDLRGEFVRGYDDSRGVDSGRSLGSSQDGTEFQTYKLGWQTRNVVNYEEHDDSSTTTAAGGASTGGDSLAYHKYKTRPRNVALLACIKY